MTEGGAQGSEEGGGGILGVLVVVTLTLSKGETMMDGRANTRPTEAAGVSTLAVGAIS